MIFLDILLTRFLWSKQASCIIKLSRILINHTTQACTLVLLIGSTLLQLYFCLLIFQTLSASTTFKYRVILEPDSGTQFGHLMKSSTLLPRDGWLSNTALNRDSVWFYVTFRLCRWMLAQLDLCQPRVKCYIEVQAFVIKSEIGVANNLRLQGEGSTHCTLHNNCKVTFV